MEKNNNIALKIKELMSERGLSQADLASLAGITPQTMTNLLNNKHIPKRVTLEKIAGVFDVYVEYLTGETLFRDIACWEDVSKVVSISQDKAILNLLAAFGYKVIKDGGYYLSVECPNKETKVLPRAQLNVLFLSFVGSLEQFMLPKRLFPYE